VRKHLSIICGAITIIVLAAVFLKTHMTDTRVPHTLSSLPSEPSARMKTSKPQPNENILTQATRDDEILDAIAMDGDSVSLTLRSGKTVTIDLTGIDAPELDQPFGLDSRKILASLLAAGHWQLQEPHDQAIGAARARVVAGGVDLSEALISRGAAWVSQDTQPGAELQRLQDTVERQHLGLWKSDTRPTQPCAWRGDC
jgi:endonuclease YncB( thermonuclease family)